MKTKIVYTMAIVIICTSLASCQPPKPYYENPYKNYQYWYKGNTHTHTDVSVSDGVLSTEEVANLYSGAAYKFIVLTDHNTVNTNAVGSLLILRGCESGDYWEHHLTAIDVASCPEECGSHFGSGDLPPCNGPENQKRINQALNQNGLVILNHPGTGDDGWPNDEAIQMQGFNGVEISDSKNDLLIWFYLLSHGRMIWGIASDDFHEGVPGGRGWIVVNSNLDKVDYQDIKANIQNGNFYSVVRGEKDDRAFFPKIFTVNPIGNNVAVSFTGASLIRFFDCWGLLESKFISDQGVTGLESYIPNQGANLRLPQGYLRVELEDQTGNIAYSQPLHVIGADACPSMPAPPPPTPTCSTGYHRCGMDCYPNDVECP